MDTKEVFASLVLNSLIEVHPKRFQSLIQQFGNAGSAICCGVPEWSSLPDFDPLTIQKIGSDIDRAKKEAEDDLKKIDELGLRIYLLHSGPYPVLLREIANPPPIIYVWGEDICSEVPTVALVGSRRASYYGEKMARHLSSDLAEAGVVTISGLARGIDTAVHKATLESKGKTWAVIGSGLSKIYPPENRALAEKIVSSGAIISEFSMNTSPFPSNFPRRNRIIAGLSLGTVVVEGTQKSGSLITARLAAEEGREVFAVPGPATSNLSEAPNSLIRLGAKMVESATDILEEFALQHKEKLLTTALSEDSNAEESVFSEILEFVGSEAISREELLLKFGQEITQLPRLLMEMELKGKIRSVPGGRVVKN